MMALRSRFFYLSVINRLVYAVNLGVDVNANGCDWNNDYGQDA